MEDNIKVCVRIRPLSELELPYEREGPVWSYTDTSIVGTLRQVLSAPASGRSIQSFEFDHVFGPDSRTIEIYNALGSKIIEAGLNGINGTLFAYGQTASGMSL